MADGKMKSGEILLYNNGGDKEFVSVIFKDENFWLTQKAMAELFACTADNISLHLKNIFADEELDKDAVTEKFSVTAADGKNYRTQCCNLDAIIAVGYRVNSKKATRFRQWATKTLKAYIQKGFVLNAELMAEDEQLMSMQDWLDETDRFLANNRRKVLPGKGSVSHDDAVKKVSGVYAAFRKKQDADYISEFDRETARYLKGGGPK